LPQHKKIPGFTLIEVSVVIAIFGVIASAIFKGIGVLESAKIHATKQDFEKYRYAIMSYQDQFQALPGDDAKASEKFDMPNGNGNGMIDSSDIPLVWEGLYYAKLISEKTAPSSRFGGQFNVVYQPESDMPGHWLCLSGKDGEGVLTPSQAKKLQGDIIIKDGKNQTGCIQGQVVNLKNTNPVCVAYLSF
jgi:prepilin-type N-terminal cleavage/methylation domain-containing protein